MGRVGILKICLLDVSLILGASLFAGCNGSDGSVPHLAIKSPSTALAPTESPAPTPKTSEDEPLTSVDLRDIVRYKASGSKEAKAILDKFASSPETFFPDGVRFLKNGPTLDPSSQKDSIYGVEIATSKDAPGGGKDLTVNTFYHASDVGFQFRIFDILLDKGHSVKQVTVTRDLPASQTMFTIKLGLLQRKVILEDAELGIRKIYPVGLGGFDEGTLSPGKTSVLTPRFKAALLEKSLAEFSRTIPSYYAGRPFVRISNGSGIATQYGLHYSITPTLVRGFVSHGCIRMRDKDLYELYYLLTQTSQGRIPLEMRYRLKDADDSPYPLDDANYQAVQNFGTTDNPEIRHDTDGLFIMDEKKGPPPAAGFIDNLTNGFNRYFNLQ